MEVVSCTAEPVPPDEPLEKKAKTEDPPSEQSLDNDDGVSAAAPLPTSTTDTLTKNQRKKLAKLAKWETVKKLKRAKEREKYRQKRRSAVENGQPTRSGPSRKALKLNRMADSPNAVRVAIDLEFDALMMDKDICKCAKQLLWVYTINRKAKMPLQLYYTGLEEGGRLQQAMDKNDGYRNWDVHIGSESYRTLFQPPQQVVYLTSDSDTVLTELDPDKVYIIGGLVDHNHHKGVSLERATANGFQTARLPLGEHVKIKTRTVLTIVHGMMFVFF